MTIDQTRESIVNVANRLFARFGFHKTTMDEIARIARKAKSSLYYHFASKEELFREVLISEISRLKGQLSVIVNDPGLPATEKMKLYLIQRMQLLHNSPNYHETLRADFYEQFHFIDDLRKELDEWEKENLGKIISQGEQSGEYILPANKEIIIEVLLMVMKGLEIPFFLQNKYDRYAPHFDSLISILHNGLKS